tara:strand:+ start:174 stop:944 length:771 start_codon:yes stop_codon:yes gene_type:complete
MNTHQIFDLQGKTALVTGCNRGIGKAMALGLAKAGADIIGISSSINKADSAVEREIESIGQKFYAYQVDLSDRNSIYTFVKLVKQDHPVIDILINNAGIILRTPAAEHSDEYWDQVLNVNLDAPFILAREIGKDMIGRGYGKIIFTASLLTFQGGINVPGYTAAKSAIGGLVKALSNEWAGKGVNVNAIAPGYINTDNTEALRNDPVRNRSILERIPAGRWGLPQDFEGPVVFLASSASDYVSGTTLTVDGGWMGR